MREAYYHEDNYCQLELVAEANWYWCVEQMGQIDKFAAAHRAEVGWTDMYGLSDHPTPLTTLNISQSQFAECIPVSVPRFDRVFTGYGTSRTECKSTIAFGPHDSLVTYAELDGNDVVAAVWFTFDLKSSKDAVITSELTTAFSRWPLLIADWGWSKLIRLTDTEALTKYYHDRVEVFGRT